MSSPHSSTVSLTTLNPLLRSSVQSSSRPRSEADSSSRNSLDPWGDLSIARTAPIIALCHLSWDWVWQRPQQYLSRLAKTHRVLFVETYCSDTPVTSVRLRTPEGHPNVTICEMHLPAKRWSDGKFIDRERRRALQRTLVQELPGRFTDAILWFNDPMAVTAFAGHLDESLIVYDCMDELSQFKGAPPELLQRERELLEVADVVFCGGRKMRDKRLRVNPNSHFYGTGVDCRHFGTALSPSTKVAPEIAALNGPVLGYFGVVDERIDYELLAALADANPKWHVVMVGPFAKVDPAQFPQRPNLHWLGGRAYADLPAFTKGFSVCLMPFALNEATEYINPTKALEYMAAGRPVVSTALDEVKSNFSNVARIAKSPAEFIALCRREVEAPSQARIARGLKLAAENTWEANVAKMEAHVADALAARREHVSAEVTAPVVPLLGNQSAYV
ncbi:MAG TPA: glycosyltransferase [Opitutus sp.]|nr:glycosyltransferase [Opitutus sp.]